MENRILERLIEELVKEMKAGDRDVQIGFAIWAVEQGIQARNISKISEDKEMFSVSESLFAVGLDALLSAPGNQATKSLKQ